MHMIMIETLWNYFACVWILKLNWTISNYVLFKGYLNPEKYTI